MFCKRALQPRHIFHKQILTAKVYRDASARHYRSTVDLLPHSDAIAEKSPSWLIALFSSSEKVNASTDPNVTSERCIVPANGEE